MAVVLAAVGVLLVVSYANRADERALEGLETDDVYVATAEIPEGTSAEQLDDLVETRAVPRDFQEPGAVTDLASLENRVAGSRIGAGEQLQERHFATPDELRSRGEFELPEEAQDLHQVTIPLENPRALGGSIAPGDTVGVFGSFTVQSDAEYALDDEGNVLRIPDDGEAGDGGDAEGEGVGDFSITDLLLQKALVVRVEGGYVAAPTNDDEEAEDAGPADTIHVTLALEAEEAGQVIYAVEFGTVWMTLQPEGSDEDDPRTIVLTVPERARNVVE
ncbi:Flp pilus assembly protein CpaB [Ornithinimicrobium sp. W1679]|uniref:Flp pilus assembly protein CpaB n=1 Tax=Ornithinimicrobium sp. W1679 TaxID=3418770 RepID=UPI003CF0EBBD